MHEFIIEHLPMGTASMKQGNESTTQRKKVRRVNMELTTAGTKKILPVRLPVAREDIERKQWYKLT